jgi:hypothetical protein
MMDIQINTQKDRGLLLHEIVNAPVGSVVSISAPVVASNAISDEASEIATRTDEIARRTENCLINIGKRLRTVKNP